MVWKFILPTLWCFTLRRRKAMKKQKNCLARIFSALRASCFIQWIPQNLHLICVFLLMDCLLSLWNWKIISPGRWRITLWTNIRKTVTHAICSSRLSVAWCILLWTIWIFSSVPSLQVKTAGSYHSTKAITMAQAIRRIPMALWQTIFGRIFWQNGSWRALSKTMRKLLRK